MTSAIGWRIANAASTRPAAIQGDGPRSSSAPNTAAVASATVARSLTRHLPETESFDARGSRHSVRRRCDIDGNQDGIAIVRTAMRNRLIRATTAVTAATSALLVFAAPAFACGGLVGENGTIQLTRTTTLAAYHDGLEHYVTSFEFSGQGQQVGSIVPLPGIPTAVERGGDWTLQRLEREVDPPPPKAEFARDALSASASGAEVILQTKIDALEITILKGGGTEVGKWATDHGFLLTPDAPEVLDYYSRRSPIFMAARFDATAAAERGQNAGDGTPIHLTIPLDRPWVPLRILALGRDRDSIVQADVFMLTDHKPQLLTGDRGLDLARSEPASAQLLDDLRADKGMEWVPQQEWLTYLKIDTPAGALTHDLAASVNPFQAPSRLDAGITSGNSFINTLTSSSAANWYAPFLISALLRCRWSRSNSPRRAVATRSHESRPVALPLP